MRAGVEVGDGGRGDTPGILVTEVAWAAQRFCASNGEAEVALGAEAAVEWRGCAQGW